MYNLLYIELTIENYIFAKHNININNCEALENIRSFSGKIPITYQY